MADSANNMNLSAEQAQKQSATGGTSRVFNGFTAKPKQAQTGSASNGQGQAQGAQAVAPASGDKLSQVMEKLKAYPHIVEVLKTMPEVWGGSEGISYDDVDSICASMLSMVELARKQRLELAKLKGERKLWESYVQGKADGERKQWEAFRQQMGKGRNKIAIDWGKYDHLKCAGLNQKQIAEVMGLSVGTLRTNERKRSKGEAQATTTASTEAQDSAGQ